MNNFLKDIIKETGNEYVITTKVMVLIGRCNKFY